MTIISAFGGSCKHGRNGVKRAWYLQKETCGGISNAVDEHGRTDVPNVHGQCNGVPVVFHQVIVKRVDDECLMKRIENAAEDSVAFRARASAKGITEGRQPDGS